MAVSSSVREWRRRYAFLFSTSYSKLFLLSAIVSPIVKTSFPLLSESGASRETVIGFDSLFNARVFLITLTERPQISESSINESSVSNQVEPCFFS